MDTIPLALNAPNPSIRIRPVRLSDLDALMRDCWTDRTEDVGRWLLTRVSRNARDNRGLGVVVVSQDGKQLIGYGQVTLWPRCAEISDLIVSERFRSRGIGTSIIQYLMRAAQEMGATSVEIGAAESNPGAVVLYRRLGFTDTRTVYMNLGSGEREPVIYMQIRLPHR